MEVHRWQKLKHDILLRGGPRNSELFLCSPRYKRIFKETALAKDGPYGILTICLISIRELLNVMREIFGKEKTFAKISL